MSLNITGELSSEPWKVFLSWFFEQNSSCSHFTCDLFTGRPERGCDCTLHARTPTNLEILTGVLVIISAWKRSNNCIERNRKCHIIPSLSTPSKRKKLMFREFFPIFLYICRILTSRKLSVLISLLGFVQNIPRAGCPLPAFVLAAT